MNADARRYGTRRKSRNDFGRRAQELAVAIIGVHRTSASSVEPRFQPPPSAVDSVRRSKLWIEAEVRVAKNHGLSEAQLAEAVQAAKERRDEIADAWCKHFRR